MSNEYLLGDMVSNEARKMSKREETLGLMNRQKAVKVKTGIAFLIERKNLCSVKFIVRFA